MTVLPIPRSKARNLSRPRILNQSILVFLLLLCEQKIATWPGCAAESTRQQVLHEAHIRVAPLLEPFLKQISDRGWLAHEVVLSSSERRVFYFDSNPGGRR